MELTSVENPKVKFWQKLQRKKYRDLERLFLIEDEHLINEALKKAIVKEIITIDNTNNYNVPTYIVTPKIMKLVSMQVSGAKIIAVCYMLKEEETRGNILILDRLQDPGNLGTILRSAVAFNFETIVLSDDSVDLYNPKVIRSSEGMFFHLNIIRTNIIEYMKNLSSSYTIIGTDVLMKNTIKEIKFDKCALVIGNEGKGISEEVKALCEHLVIIPMNSNCESLNASVSASILMYEVSNG